MLYTKQAKILFFSLVLLLFGISFFILQTNNYASAELFKTDTKVGDNFSGWAWSENYGWISFNSSNCDTNGNGSTDACAGAGTNVADYGVNVNHRNDVIDGYAWSSNIGWINFTGTSYDKSSGELTGTAKIIALGADGDLKLRDAGANPFVVTVDNNEASPSYGEMGGYAWNENDTVNTGMGWLKFKGATYGVTADLNKTPTIDAGSDSLSRTNPVELVMDGNGAGSGVISAGDTANFSASWDTNPITADDSDNARIFICKDNTGIDTSAGTSNLNNASLAQKGIDSWTCNGNTWCAGTATTNANLNCNTTMDESIGVGANKKYYTYICDEFAYCISPLQSNPFIINDRPGVGNPDVNSVANNNDGSLEVITAPPLLAVDPEGDWDDHKINFDADWDDNVTGGSITMYVCGINSFDYDRNNLGCNGRQWCDESINPGTAISGTITNCAGETNNSDIRGVKDYYVYICDGYGACTTDADSLSNGHGQFLVNARPEVAKGANGMSAPNWNPTDASTNDYSESDLRAILKWDIDDTADGALATGLTDAQLEVVGVAGTGNGDSVTKKDSDSANQFGVPGPACTASACSVELLDVGPPPRPLLNMLSWGTSYKWTAWVRDEYAWSEPLAYDHSGTDAVLTDDVNGGHYGNYGVGLNNTVNTNSGYASPSLTFTTYKHNFPIVNASTTNLIFPPGVSYFPKVPSADEEVKATPNSYYYTDNTPASGANPLTSGNGATQCAGACSYNLYISNTVGELKNTTTDVWGDTLSNAPIPVIMKFFHDGDSADQGYTLTAVDSDGYFDTDNPASIDYVNESLPSWEEVQY